MFPAAAPGSKTAASFGKGGFEGEDRSRDWDCPKCKERNFLKRFECHKCRFPRPLSHGDSLPSSTPRRGVSPHAGSRAMAQAAMLGAKARSGSGDSDSSESGSSSSSKSARSPKKKKKSRKKSSSSSSSENVV